MATPSAVAGDNGAATWRARAGGILLAGLGGFLALVLVGMLAQKTAQPWISASLMH